MMISRAVGAAGLAAALVAVGAASAGADGEPVGDAREDSSGGGISRDIKGATHGHQGKFLRHGVSVFGKEIDQAGLKIYINTDRTAAPNYVAGVVDDAPAVRRVSDGAVTGALHVVVVSETKLRYLFKPSAIGKPRAYGWFATFEQKGGKDVFDRAPNAGYEKHRLTK